MSHVWNKFEQRAEATSQKYLLTIFAYMYILCICAYAHMHNIHIQPDQAWASGGIAALHGGRILLSWEARCCCWGDHDDNCDDDDGVAQCHVESAPEDSLVILTYNSSYMDNMKTLLPTHRCLYNFHFTNKNLEVQVLANNLLVGFGQHIAKLKRMIFKVKWDERWYGGAGDVHHPSLQRDHLKPGKSDGISRMIMTLSYILCLRYCPTFFWTFLSSILGPTVISDLSIFPTHLKPLTPEMSKPGTYIHLPI